ncbi:MAG: hypothetical protein AB7I04_22735 [Pseudomonadales bacterium]
MREDAYGLALTTSSDTAAAAYRLAADRLLTGTGDPLAAADAAIAEDPDLAVAHSARATALLFASQPKAARDAAEKGLELATGASRRERQHAAIILDVVSGKRDPALARIREHMAEFPRDALGIDPAAGVFGLIGFSGRQNREAEQVAFLEPLAPHYGDDWWYQHALGFALLENDAADRALALVEAAVNQRPDSGHAAHTFVHGLFEAGEFDPEARGRAMRWLSHWLPTYTADGILYCHLWWHLALFHLLDGDFDAMWSAYDAHCLTGQSASPVINLYTDGVALAWRSMVAGADRPIERLESLRKLGEANFPKPGIFVDVHRGACLAALGDRAALAEFREALESSLTAGRLAAGEVVIRLVDGFDAFAEEDWTKSVALLSAAEPEVVRIGGSRAQRRLVAETLAAARRYGD